MTPNSVLQIMHARMHLTIIDWANSLGPRFRLRLADKTVVVFSDASVMPLLGAGPQALPKAGFAYAPFMELSNGHRGMFDTLDFHDPEWKIARKGLAVFFAMNNLKTTVFPVLRWVSSLSCRHTHSPAAAGGKAGQDI